MDLSGWTVTALIVLGIDDMVQRGGIAACLRVVLGDCSGEEGQLQRRFVVREPLWC
jgi:hypothetical protein